MPVAQHMQEHMDFQDSVAMETIQCREIRQACIPSVIFFAACCCIKIWADPQGPDMSSSTQSQKPSKHHLTRCWDLLRSGCSAAALCKRPFTWVTYSEVVDVSSGAVAGACTHVDGAMAVTVCWRRHKARSLQQSTADAAVDSCCCCEGDVGEPGQQHGACCPCTALEHVL